MKNSLKSIAKFILCSLISFATIYLFVFCGGYKLFESGDVIFQEIGASLIIGFILYVSYELFAANNKRIEKLEKRVEELEDQINNSSAYIAGIKDEDL